MLSLDWQLTATRLQLWRPLTAFLNFGPLGPFYILTANFIWTYMSNLEKMAFEAPWEFVTMMGFGAAALLATTAALELPAKQLGHGLSCFLVYVWARKYEGADVNVMDLFNLRAELLPWFFALQTYVLEGEPPVYDCLAIAIGHLYHLAYKRGLRGGGPLRKWFEGNDALMARYARFGEEFAG